MRVRLFELRLLAVVLTGLWTIAAGLVLLGYRPGGPIDLVVGTLGSLPIAISLAAVVWPPAARGDRAFAAVMWLGLGSALLLVPSIGGLLNQLLASGPQTLLPSLEAGYPWLLALLGTSLFAGLGLSRRLLGQTAMRRRRLQLGVGIATAATILSGSLFTGAAIANDLAIEGQPVAGSRFGPAGEEPPATCHGPIAPAPTATIELHLAGDVDGHAFGTADLRGARNGADVRWTADVATQATIGLYGVARLAGQAWSREPRSSWHLDPAADSSAPVLDALLLATALSPGNRVAAEEHGLEFIEGARARHCRIAIDGPRFAAAFPQVAWMSATLDLHRWRGQLDYWLFADGELGQVVASINGAALSLGMPGIQANLRATLTATNRGGAVTITAPPE